MTRTKWNGKDWREFTCGECGYWEGHCQLTDIDKAPCIKHPGINRSRMDDACPDFEPRDIPDPEYPDERVNLDHIKEEDRHGVTD